MSADTPSSLVFYNDNDAFCAQWLRNLGDAGLLPVGFVDERSIIDIEPSDLAGYEQCHFFAGIGGWPYALSLAGWRGPVWTGSCPCQPLSSAAHGRNRRQDAKEHLWPTWFRLIAECRPRTIFGEQVALAGDWFDGVCDDLEELGYAVGASVLPACGIGFDHTRSRLFFVAHTDSYRQPSRAFNGEMAQLPEHHSVAGTVAHSHGVSNSMGRLRAYGNAIVPQVAAQFVSAFIEIAGKSEERASAQGGRIAT